MVGVIEMSDLAKLANIAEVLGAAIVIGGLFFAVLQMRQIRQQRRDLAAIELFRSFGSPQFTEALHLVLYLPDGLGTEEIKANYPQQDQCAILICTTLENIGVMTFQRIVPFILVNNLIGATTIVLWRKLALWVTDLRVQIDNPAAFEWFQWLAEKLEEYDSITPLPAYEMYKDWKPIRLTNEE
jgi:hypothetical protein